MIRILFMSLLVVGLLHSAVQAQGKKDGKDEFKKEKEPPGDQPPKKKSSGGDTPAAAQKVVPGEVEIQFLNGSKIRVVVQTDKLEIVSIYGKLAVPIEDVISIEFGLHYPDGAVEKIDAAIKNLSSGDFRVRETAAKTLIKFGPYAYPAALRATKAKDSETAERAKEIVQKLQAKYSKKELKTSTDDRVVTPTQTLVGRILTQTVKTNGEYFGEMEHKLVNMRSLRAVGGSVADVDVALDAGKYANAGQWFDSTYQLDGKSSVLIVAKGSVDQWPQQPGAYMCGPGGVNLRGGFPGGGGGGGGGQMVPGAKIRVGGANFNQYYGGMLIGKIGEDGEPFVIGDRYELKSESEGRLFLHIGPSPWNCASSGTYDVKISRRND